MLWRSPTPHPTIQGDLTMIDAEHINDWVEQGREQFDQARERVSEVDTKLRSFAREQPLMALLVAATGGFVLARLASMRLR